jgi:hypothetical protein
MIKKEFVSYEEALALKELGFNEPCFGFWNYNDSKMYYWNDEEIQNERTNTWFLDTEKKFPKISKNGCTAPTFSQAFRWFREKYGLKSWIQEHTADTFIYEIRPHKLTDYKEGEIYVYEVYEEAEIACLKKLIKIAKEKTMSNTKQSMKLYTEEQVIDIFQKYGNMSAINARNILDLSESIELPSDEEIDVHVEDDFLNATEVHKYSEEAQLLMKAMCKAGALWMRDKIQGGNNEQQ